MSEIMFEADNTKSKGPEADIDFSEALYKPEKLSTSELLEMNQKTIEQYTAKVCDHFDKVLQKVPAWMQADFISGIKVLGDEPVYAGMIDRYNARAAVG
ncbi:MAG: hypothetical protein K8F91_21975 [Candidatus Obscuribacterales bacterium]|nr:hypothetical protein [Candidatus Obscuribacterales bacterium]